MATTAMEVQGGESLGDSGRNTCGITVLCVVSGCNARAGKTGFCGECLPQVVADLLREMRPMRINPATLDAAWYRENTGGVLSRDEAQELRRAVMAKHAGALQGLPERDAMRDFDTSLVADEPANRERRAALMAKLPRVHVADGAVPQQGTPWYAWVFTAASFAALLLACFFALKGRGL